MEGIARGGRFAPLRTPATAPAKSTAPRVRALRCMAAALLCIALPTGCMFSRGPVGVDEVRPEEVRAVVSGCVLDGKGLSAATREILEAHDLQRLHEQDRFAALRALHALAVAEPRPGELFALAELSYLAGLRRRDRDCFLASAVYAYYFLLGTEGSAHADPYDRRFRWACDLYNGALMRAFAAPDARSFVPEDGQRDLPSGSLTIAVRRQGPSVDGAAEGWGLPDDVLTFLPADRLLVRGLKLRLRDSGLGVPLIGLLAPDAAPDAAGSLLQQRTKEVPATAFLRLEGSLTELERGIPATLELHSGFEAASVMVGEQRVPLETDRSATLAHGLDRSEVWSFSLTGFFSSEGSASANKLILVQPYRRGRVPVVFVHGTASSPGYWADLFNTLWGDPELRRAAQFWFFRYTTGNPIAYSAADLRAALAEALTTLDPDGEDPALRQMVVIGHSQGGLLAKLMAVEGDSAWLEQATGLSIADLGLDPEQSALLERVLDFEPMPAVRRVVFVSTPHHGSFLADTWYSRLLARLIRLPQEIGDIDRRLMSNAERFPREVRARIPTSLTNMNADNPYLLNVLASPIAPAVVSHSIISIGDADPTDPESLAEADDGVVAYTSAHIDGVASEFLVPSGHSCQSHPATIQETRRILLEHVRALGLTQTPSR